MRWVFPTTAGMYLQYGPAKGSVGSVASSWPPQPYIQTHLSGNLQAASYIHGKSLFTIGSWKKSNAADVSVTFTR